MRPRASTIIRLFLSGCSIGEIAFKTGADHDYIEDCLRRDLHGKVKLKK